MKNILFVFLAITAATAENLICEPGSLFKKDCNSCTCSQDGKFFACTDMICPPEIILLDQIPETTCTPGSLFEVDCNTCTCAPDGKSAACTDKICPPTVTNHDGINKICEPLSKFFDYCNTCLCSEDGTNYGCTMMECDKKLWNKNGTKKEIEHDKIDSDSAPKKVCEPLSTFKDYCNTCFCSEDGTNYGCTMMECDKEIWNKDGTSKLLRSEDSESKQVCQPRSVFKEYCNTCSCADDGLTYACTRMFCDKSLWNKDGTMKVVERSMEEDSESKQVCQPRSVFKEYCNTCSCADDGLTYACTRMFCDENIWNKDGTMKVVERSLEENSAPKQVCQPRSTFKNYCNTCSCSDDGMSFACTRMHCDKDLWNKDGSKKVEKSLEEDSVPKQVCQPRSVFKEYCNTCSCADDGMSFACTRMFCDKDVWNKDGTSKLLRSEDSEPKQVCQPRSVFKDYCNTCSCADDGLTYACTRMFCDKSLWNKDGSMKVVERSLEENSAPKQVCQPRSTFKNYCNTCSCSDDGMSFACTRMFCDKDIWNKDGSSKLLRSEDSESKQVCQPRSVFKEYCNTCSCADDGLTYACTRMFCDENIWNKDGTMKVVERSMEEDSESKQVCQPRSVFKDYCNTCSCADDGLTYACTRMFCDKNIWNKDGSSKLVVAPTKDVCEPGEKFIDMCDNICSCVDASNAVCTRMACPENVEYYNKDGTIKVKKFLGEAEPVNKLNSLSSDSNKVEDSRKWGPLYKQGDKCSPNKVFYSECNRCICTKSGRSAFCTLMEC